MPHSGISTFEQLAPWLKTPYLTRALKCACPEYNFKRLNECWATPTKYECQRLGICENEPVWRRSSLHFNGKTPLVFCRLSLPKNTYTHHLTALSGLGDRQIGDALLFDCPNVVRSAFTFDETTPEDEAYSVLGQSHTPYWSRTSLFEWDAQALLLTEVFALQMPVWIEYAS